MTIGRRKLSALLLVASLSACAQSPSSGNGTTQQTISVTLEGAQAEASAIISAVETYAPAIIATLGAADQPKANSALAAAQAAVTAFVNMPANGTAATYANTAVLALQAVLPYAGVSGGTLIAIQAGLALIGGLINGLSSVTVTTPTVTTTPASVSLKGRAVIPPILIPPMSITK